MFTKKIFGEVRDERGLALVVALMLLVLMTVMGIAAISTTSTELKLTGNERSDAQAFHTAEAGIKEILYRSGLWDLGGGVNATVANGGTFVDPEGTPFDAQIRDPADPPNINWRVNVYFKDPPPGPPPAGETNVRSILPISMWDQLKYSNDGGDPDLAGEVLHVRYLKESDLPGLFGYANGDRNGDNDDMDLVYYNPAVGGLNSRVGAGLNNPVNPPRPGVADTQPPAGLVPNEAIRLVESVGYGFRSKAKKRILLETTGFPINPNVNAAVTAGVRLDLGGNGFVSGFNHKKDTVIDDVDNTNSSQFDNNGCDNSNAGTEGGDCNAAYEGAGNDPDIGEVADYSGKWETGGHKAAVVSGEEPETAGDNTVWGGNSDNADPTDNTGWKDIEAGVEFPTLEEMLNITTGEKEDLLSHANTDPDVCPRGITYIDNAASGDVFKPSQTCSSGSGILVVTGDFKITNDFEFRGLIYVTGDAELRGGSFILGSMAVEGHTEGLKATNGHPTILYSQEVIQNAIAAAMSSTGFSLTTISWREY